jgi:hypothetical protein
MEQEHLLILDLVYEGKITVPEALELIEAMDGPEPEYGEINLDNQSFTVQLCLN